MKRIEGKVGHSGREMKAILGNGGCRIEDSHIGGEICLRGQAIKPRHKSVGHGAEEEMDKGDCKLIPWLPGHVQSK